MSNLEMTTREAQVHKEDLTMRLETERDKFFEYKLVDTRPSTQPAYDTAIERITGQLATLGTLAPEDVPAWGITELGTED